METPDIPITIYGDVDAHAVEQLERCARAGDAVAGALCADAHVGYSQPIGGVVAYPGHISPSGVGYDIACIAAGTAVTTADGWWRPIEQIPSGAPVEGWDGRRVRRVAPCFGAVSRGRAATLRVLLRNGTALQATPEHLVRTPLGWRRADALGDGDRVACHIFVGLPHARATGDIHIAEPSRAAGLAERGLWPLRADDTRLPALLRLLGVLCGDGHLHRDGKAVSWWTVVPEDAATIAHDVRRLGFTPTIHVRSRDPKRRAEHCVRVSSVALHSLFAALGCPVGRKVDGWPQDPMRWLFVLPGWMRAQVLSGFASAEATTPAMRRDGGAGNVAIKQAGTATHAIGFVAELFGSLGFRSSITASGPARGAVRTHVLQILGGTEEQLRFFREIGYCHALEKRVAAAAVGSVAWQLDTVRDRRAAAVAEAERLRVVGALTVRAIVEKVSAEYNVPASLAFHGLYGRGRPRAGAATDVAADHSGEVAWVPVAGVQEGGPAPVFDVVTGDDAQAFAAGGVCVHNCGNKAARTNLRAADIRADLPRLMDDVFARISFGVGRKNAEPVDHPVLERIKRAEFEPQRALHDLAVNQLGTVGAGNHYVDLFEDEDGFVWVGVHFGSRGFGHKTASGFLALAKGAQFGEHAPEGEMDSPPVLLPVDTELGQAYIEAMQLAGDYAYAGRDVVVAKVLEILGAEATYEVHNHHNFAWKESHFGTDVWVVRKGCTPAFPGQEGFVGATMGEPSVILRGVDAPQSAGLLYSTVHGAGRVMSRTQAAGRMGQRAECTDRDCDFWVPWAEYRHERNRHGGGEHKRFTLCPHHPHGNMVKRRGRVKPGRIDYNVVRAEIARQGIELRGGAADEAPEAYKRLDTVLAAHGDTIEIVHRLTPIGVAMAGADTFDPYKD